MQTQVLGDPGVWERRAQEYTNRTNIQATVKPKALQRSNLFKAMLLLPLAFRLISSNMSLFHL